MVTRRPFATALPKMGLLYAVGIRPGKLCGRQAFTVAPIPQPGRGRPSSLLRRGPGHEPVSVKELAMDCASGIPAGALAEEVIRPCHRDPRHCAYDRPIATIAAAEQREEECC